MEGIIILKGTVVDIKSVCSFVSVKLEYSGMWQRCGMGALGRKMLTKAKNCVDITYRGCCSLVKPELFKFHKQECQMFGIPALEPPADDIWGVSKEDLHLGDKVVVFITWEKVYYDDGSVENEVQDVVIYTLNEKPLDMYGLVDAVVDGGSDDVTFF